MRAQTIFTQWSHRIKELYPSNKEVFTAIGNGDKRLHKEERENGRRDGLYFSKNLDIGHKIQIGDLKVQRPSPGLRSRYSELAIGLQLRNKVKTDQPVFLSDLEL